MASQSFRVKKGLEVGVGGTIITTTEDGNVGLGTTNPTAKLQVSGDIKIDDGGTYSTTIQSQTPTADRVITYPDKTGTIALVAGSSGQVTYNLAGINTGDSNFTYDATSGLTLGKPLTVTDNVNISGIGTIATLDTTTGTIDYLSNTNLNTSGIGTIATLDTTTGTIDYLSNTNLNTSGIATIANLRVGIGYTVLPFSDAIGYGLNVREFGATGDGVTDDRTFIQAGINSARATGKPLIFPPGQYRLGTRGLSISGDVKLIGAGGTITWGVQDPLFALGAIIGLSGVNSNIIIDGLKFESNDNNQAFNSWFNSGSLGRFELRNCEFRSGAGTTVPNLLETGDSDIEETKLTNCYFFNTGNIWRTNYSTGTHKSVTIEGCTFDESPVIGMNSPSGYVRGVVISNNQIKNISSPIQSDGGDYVSIVGNVFENVGVVYLPEQFAKRVVISDNMCVDVGQLIKGWSQSGNFVITNNSIIGRKLRFNQRFGVNDYDTTTVGTAVTVPWNVNSYPGELKVYRSTPLNGGVDEYLMSPYSYTFTSSGSGTSGISTITFFGKSYSLTTFKVEQYLMQGSAVVADDYDSYNNGVQGGIIANNFIEGFDVAFDLETSKYTWTIENNRIRNCNVAFRIFGDGQYKTPVLGNNNTLSGVTTAVLGDSPIEIGKLNYEDVRDFYIDVPFSADNIPNLVNVNDWDTNIRGFSCPGISANRTIVSNRTGTLASSGVSTITGISTSNIVTGLVVSGNDVSSGIITAFGSTTQTLSNPSSTVVISVGAGSITVNRPFTNVGIATTTFTFTAIEPNRIQSADNQIQILPSLPYHMVGKLKVRTTEITSGQSQFFGEYDIRYDGTTFIYQILRKYGTGAYNGGVGFTPNFGFSDDLYISNGKLYFQAYNNGSTSYAEINFDFDGDLIYRASSNSKSFYGEQFVNFSNTYSYDQGATGYSLATIPSAFDVIVTCNGNNGPVMLLLPPPVPGRKVTVINRSTSAWTSIRTFNRTNHKILGLIPRGTVSTSTFTATAGQTTFSTSYDVGYIDVYVNGVRLTSGEYTATNGTSIVLSTSCFGGEKVDIKKIEKEQIKTTDSTIGIGNDPISYNPDYANIQLLAISYNRWQVISSFPSLTRDRTGWVFSSWDTV